MAKKKKPSKKTLIRKLDNACRRYINLRDNFQCVTCGIHKLSTPLKQLDCSHYISRRFLITRWLPHNMILQCRSCHKRWHDGFATDMVKAINDMFGEQTTDKLELLAKETPSIKGTDGI